MCGTCGCGEHHHHDHLHDHEYWHGHEHHHRHHGEGKVITLEQDILQRNNLFAERNRGYFEAKYIFCLNLMSSPGSGKTTLLEETIRQLNSDATLVCPAMFDLGEAKKVVIVSTTEGDDKPLKYPHIFLEADICVINKIDLAPYLDTDVETLRNNALKVNHHLQLFEVSATKGTGMDAWCDWLVKECAKCKFTPDLIDKRRNRLYLFPFIESI